MVSIGLGEVELMSNHAEASPERPTGRDAADALRRVAAPTTPATWTAVRRIFDEAGIELRSLCYNMNVKTLSDADIEYGLAMAKQLGVKVMSTSTQVSMAKRVAPFADQHQILVALSRPRERAAARRGVHAGELRRRASPIRSIHAINLDIGHFTAAGFDALAFICASTTHGSRTCT